MLGVGNWHQLVISGNGNRWKAAGVGEWLKQLGIFGQRSHQKHLPADVFRLRERSDRASAEAHVGDGWIGDRCASSVRAEVIGCISRRAANGLRETCWRCCLRLGIVAPVKAVTHAKRRATMFSPSTSVVLTRSAAFARRWRALGRAKRAVTTLWLALEVGLSRTRTSTRCPEIADACQRRARLQPENAAANSLIESALSHAARAMATALRRLCFRTRCWNERSGESDLFWDCIVSIETSG